jgi:tetratricopeptide (TPR) repeat protein
MNSVHPSTVLQDPRLPLTERQRWTQRYKSLVERQITQVLAHVRQTHPTDLRPHLDSLLTLLYRARRWGGCDALAVELIAALHPWPFRWLRWTSWEQELRFAIQTYAEQQRPAQRAEFLAHLANLLFNGGHLGEALEAAEEALLLARRHGVFGSQAFAGCIITLIHLQQGRADEARRGLDNLLTALSRAKIEASQERIEALARLRLQRLTFLRQDNRLADAIVEADEVLAQLQALPTVDVHLIAEGYRERATMAWAAGRYPDAAHDIKRAMQIFAKQGDQFAVISAEGNLGLIYYSMTELNLAEESIHRVIMMAEQLNSRWHLAYAVDYMGVIYLTRGQLDQAIDYFDRAAALASNIGAMKDLHRIRSNRAVTRLYQGQYNEAIPDLEADLRFSEEQGLTAAGLMDRICLSLCYLELGKEKCARQLAEKAMSTAYALSNRTFEILALRCIAEHRPEHRGALLHQALARARENRRPLDEAGCLLSLAGLADDEKSRTRFWKRGVCILQSIGATGWLKDASPDNPPRVIILL